MIRHTYSSDAYTTTSQSIGASERNSVILANGARPHCVSVGTDNGGTRARGDSTLRCTGSAALLRTPHVTRTVDCGTREGRCSRQQARCSPRRGPADPLGGVKCTTPPSQAALLAGALNGYEETTHQHERRFKHTAQRPGEESDNCRCRSDGRGFLERRTARYSSPGSVCPRSAIHSACVCARVYWRSNLERCTPGRSDYCLAVRWAPRWQETGVKFSYWYRGALFRTTDRHVSRSLGKSSDTKQHASLISFMM